MTQINPPGTKISRRMNIVSVEFEVERDSTTTASDFGVGVRDGVGEGEQQSHPVLEKRLLYLWELAG